ncbi:amidohydrolase family protein [Pyxidicoccus sp. 3LFB2]
MRWRRASRWSTWTAGSPRCCRRGTRRWWTRLTSPMRWSGWTRRASPPWRRPRGRPGCGALPRWTSSSCSRARTSWTRCGPGRSCATRRLRRWRRGPRRCRTRSWQAPAARRKRFVELRRQVVRGLHTAGAGLLVGSDSPQFFMVTGFAVHREMEAMAAAGLPALAVLEAATRGAAEYLGEAAEWGTVAPGRRADLLLLDADPRQDVRNTRELAGVVLRGRWLPRSELDAMLAEVEAAVKAKAP